MYITFVVIAIMLFQSQFLTDLYTQLCKVEYIWEWEKYQIWELTYWVSLYLSYFVRILHECILACVYYERA